MNDRKRKRIQAIIVLLQELCDEEAQDLTDTPDNIEGSEAPNIEAMRLDKALLKAAIENLRSIQ